MLSATIFLWLIAALLAGLAFTRPGNEHIEGMRLAWGHLWKILPRVVMAVLTAGFLGEMLPGDMVAGWLGHDSGWRGVAIASLVGGFVPGGPVLSFPFAVAMMKTGAGVPQLTAFLAAWSVFALHRVIAFEVPLMGWRFTVVRITSSLILPPLAGGIAGLLLIAAAP